jgi:hypothetical protein
MVHGCSGDGTKALAAATLAAETHATAMRLLSISFFSKKKEASSIIFF